MYLSQGPNDDAIYVIMTNAAKHCLMAASVCRASEVRLFTENCFSTLKK